MPSIEIVCRLIPSFGHRRYVEPDRISDVVHELCDRACVIGQQVGVKPVLTVRKREVCVALVDSDAVFRQDRSQSISLPA